MGEIGAEDTPEKCLLESHKVESKIEQRKLLGIKAAISYDSVQTNNNRGRRKFRSKSQGRVDPQAIFAIVSTVGKAITKVIILPMERNVENVVNITTSMLFANPQTGEIAASTGPKQKEKKKFHKINEEEGAMDEHITEQVQSLFYNDVHFNAVNARMHTTLKCETPDGWSSDQVFKIDTGADGNLMPIKMFVVLFPKVSLDALSRTINKEVTLFTYNNTHIKQFGICSVRLSFKSKSLICNFFVVEHETALVGITDSEKLGLVHVNFHMVKNEHVKIINEVTEESFKHSIEKEYPELFKGIGLMDGEISIKLKDGVIPHVELI